MRKYYWLVYSYNNAGGSKTHSEAAIYNHPFEYMNNIRGLDGRNVSINITLINWKEISKKEYDLFKKLG